MVEQICAYHAEDLFFHHTVSPWRDPQKFPLHAHEMNEILIILSGEGVMRVEGNEYALFPGAVFLMRDGESHKIQVEAGEPYERIAIHFSPSLLSHLDPKGELFIPFRERRLGSGNVFRLRSLQGLLPSVLELGENTSSYRIRLAVTAFLYSLLIEVSNQYISEEHSFDERKELGKIYEIIEFVNQNLSNDLSLDAIAADFYLSKSQLSRSFKKATGSTLWDYVLIKRLFLARSLIREGESISGACERSGFREYSSFYRAYKKRFGVSPNQDRAVPGETKD